MKIAETNIIIVPGYTNSGEDHWQSRWQRNLSTASRVQQDDWHKPIVEEWTDSLLTSIDAAEKPVVLVAHSLGCQVVVQTALKFEDGHRSKVLGAFMVAPPDVERENIRPKHLRTFGPYPRDPLPFPSIVVASSNDPFCELEVADEMAACWGSLFIPSGEQGHFNPASGHGAWPEGLMVFSKFMNGLKAPK